MRIRMRLDLRIAGTVVLAGLCGACASSPDRSAHGIRLHEDWLADHWCSDQSCSPPAFRPVFAGIELDRPESVAFAVMRATDPLATVFPTEMYYYFEFPLGEREIHGNLRFTDIEVGLLHIGYFDTYDQRWMRFATLGPEDGVEVMPLGEQRFRVRINDAVSVFQLSDAADRPRNKLALASGEEFVSGILDDSGFYFWLLWNEPSKQFLFVLDESERVWDKLIPINAADGLLSIGFESRYIFLAEHEPSRRVLVGVWDKAIRDNTYFDGPFDQVPPRLHLRSKLESAYPYVKDRGGIDEHGNFVQLIGQRVAISPYQQYSSVSEVVRTYHENLSAGVRGYALTLALTREHKQGFNPITTPEDMRAFLTRNVPFHWQPTSQGWPANHLGSTSRHWPVDHRAEQSSQWPANAQPLDVFD